MLMSAIFYLVNAIFSLDVTSFHTSPPAGLEGNYTRSDQIVRAA